MSDLYENSGCENDDQEADVVFIHGLGGHPLGTWSHRDDDSASWPHWLGKAHPGLGVWTLGYSDSPTKWPRLLGVPFKRWRDSGHGMSLPVRGLQVLDLLVRRGLGNRPLMFICHSLGGLVAWWRNRYSGGRRTQAINDGDR